MTAKQREKQAAARAAAISAMRPQKGSKSTALPTIPEDLLEVLVSTDWAAVVADCTANETGFVEVPAAHVAALTSDESGNLTYRLGVRATIIARERGALPADKRIGKARKTDVITVNEDYSPDPDGATAIVWLRLYAAGKQAG